MRRKLTIVTMYHYVRLTYRAVLFILLLISYILYRVRGGAQITDILENRPVILTVMWVVFVVEMILRFFPFPYESPGSQKQFAKNYIRSGSTDIDIPDNNAAVLVLLIWISMNGVFGALHMSGILDNGVMILLCSFYSVCDMICILFFCPFQSWFLKNKCCSTCRIYNWDYPMMFTPLFFVPKSYAWSLLVLSMALLARWEITFYLHPERFSEKTNDYLRCANCTEKLCHHKRQLHSLWQKIEAYTNERVRFLTRTGKTDPGLKKKQEK